MILSRLCAVDRNGYGKGDPLRLRIDFETPNSRITREESSQLICILALKEVASFSTSETTPLRRMSEIGML